MVKWHKIIHPPATHKVTKETPLLCVRGVTMLATTKCMLRSRIKPDFGMLEHKLSCSNALQASTNTNIFCLSIQIYTRWKNLNKLCEYTQYIINVNKPVRTQTPSNAKTSQQNLCWWEERNSRSASTSRAKSEPASPDCEDGLHQAPWMACSWSASCTHPKLPKTTFYDIAVGSTMRPENAEVQQQQPKEGSCKSP